MMVVRMLAHGLPGSENYTLECKATFAIAPRDMELTFGILEREDRSRPKALIAVAHRPDGRAGIAPCLMKPLTAESLITLRSEFRCRRRGVRRTFAVFFSTETHEEVWICSRHGRSFRFACQRQVPWSAL